MKNDTPWSGVRLAASIAVRVNEYSDGRNEAHLLVFDTESRKVVPQFIASVEQPAKDPFSPEELLLMAALDAYARRVDPQMELPW